MLELMGKADSSISKLHKVRERELLSLITRIKLSREWVEMR